MCGFVGLVGYDNAAPDLFLGLSALQHRGQDAAGIGTYDGSRFRMHKDLGLVSSALPASMIETMEGTIGIGHVRYPTAGGGEKGDAQPFLSRRGVMMAHNGNVTNIPELREKLGERGLFILSDCDVEAILLVFGDELARTGGPATLDGVFAAVARLMTQVRGGYSVVAILEVESEPALVAFRDPHGIRPLVIGQRDDGAWMVASESVAQDVCGFGSLQHLEAGGVAVFRPGRAPEVRVVGAGTSHACVFEKIYFARADTILDDGRVNAIRWALGERLADEWAERGLDADVTVAVPDTSRPAAMAMAERLGLQNREGFIKNRYSGRTFIMPKQSVRDWALRVKLNPIREVFEGRKVILVDDSIVRGSTMRRIVQMVRGLGPKEIHVAIFSPGVRHPCFYGIDMPSKEELIAAQYDGGLEERLAEALGADSVTFLSLDGLRAVIPDPKCSACFDGDYVVPVSDAERAAILRDRRSG